MPCCGSSRASMRPETVASPSAGGSHSGGSHYWTSREVEFEYSGQGRLTVTGPLTGQVYHFAVGGARVRVHGSDAPSLVAVPGLKPVR